jgi:microcystin-dependent protein
MAKQYPSQVPTQACDILDHDFDSTPRNQPQALMKTKTQNIHTITLLVLVLASAPVFGQVTAFNYTGYLLDGGTPANGNNDLQFTLYAAPTGGSPVAGSVTKTNQPVNNGVFVVALDFGDVFDGSARWLEISARPGGSANPFTNTFPRQAITAAPYATFANNGTPPGNINASASTNVPAGWLLCDGSAVSRTTYARLFAAIGTTWGSGDGATTFNLPDLRGMFLRGTGTHGTQAKAAGGNFAGGNVGDFGADKMQGHWHATRTAPVLNGSGVLFNPVYSSGAANSSGEVQNPLSDGSNGTPRTGNETKPASYSVNYIIKY